MSIEFLIGKKNLKLATQENSDFFVDLFLKSFWFVFKCFCRVKMGSLRLKTIVVLGML
jgi:hypothetical protein